MYISVCVCVYVSVYVCVWCTYTSMYPYTHVYTVCIYIYSISCVQTYTSQWLHPARLFATSTCWNKNSLAFILRSTTRLAWIKTIPDFDTEFWSDSSHSYIYHPLTPGFWSRPGEDLWGPSGDLWGGDGEHPNRGWGEGGDCENGNACNAEKSANFWRKSRILGFWNISKTLPKLDIFERTAWDPTFHPNKHAPWENHQPLWVVHSIRWNQWISIYVHQANNKYMFTCWNSKYSSQHQLYLNYTQEIIAAASSVSAAVFADWDRSGSFWFGGKLHMYFASAKSGGSLRDLLAICDFFRLCVRWENGTQDRLILDQKFDKSAWAFGTARER